MIGNHEIHLAGNRTGVLLIHGLTGTPSEMRDVARRLHSGGGYTVHCVQLAGHCGDVDDLIATGWRDWYQSVVDAAARLRQEVDYLFVGGLSMGAILALKYASAHPVAGVLVYGATFRADGWSIPASARLLAPLLPLATRLRIGRRRTVDEMEPYGIRNEILRRRIAKAMLGGDSGAAGLPGNPWPSLSEMIHLSRNVRRNLWRVADPCLILHAEHDDVAHRRNALLVRKRVSGPCELALLKNSYHMITIDNDRDELVSRSLQFIARNACPASPPSHGAEWKPERVTGSALL
ncbi:alpha/beta hydrolase [Pluralibacter gergoviae]|uniref:Alpha/beta fold hydrolase n=1 Tax=Pluralibacter gergoviae TaxID=61647 RepID=A0AAW8HI20_PLUGE|nr:alpha/beta fold hydrolase [Pluralibacter gergoviae]AVR03257.1 alpha/beta hydrolase [Pluralibacter gergoviae]KMK02313.1 alpha/beta hydrolase [Pluralibacter gergoviae]KMK22514.1 alpha/beta hydrolase [Pluralibacter gergoviae]MDQ2308082.1 alpha/beta fold hydrolase [Pluralibacter gergoviae]SUB72763.1 Thermostable monoacylglycerol lipase [Pluralibacter gergoviae]